MLTSARREALYKKFNIDPNIIGYKTYLVTNDCNFVDVIGVELKIIPLQMSIRCNISDSITFNFKRCLKMVKYILAEYNVK